MTRKASLLFGLVLMLAACGSDDGGDGDGDDGDGSSGNSSNGTTCTCQCACCVALGDCDTPQQMDAKDATECGDKCESQCGGNFSNSYDCS